MSAARIARAWFRRGAACGLLAGSLLTAAALLAGMAWGR